MTAQAGKGYVSIKAAQLHQQLGQAAFIITYIGVFCKQFFIRWYSSVGRATHLLRHRPPPVADKGRGRREEITSISSESEERRLYF